MTLSGLRPFQVDRSLPLDVLSDSSLVHRALRSGQILVVNADAAVLVRLETMLTAAGYQTVGTTSFTEARSLLERSGFELLIADVRLGAFNGLHLAARCQESELAVLVTHSTSDAWFALEAQRFGAQFVADPANNPELLRMVRRIAVPLGASHRFAR